MSSLSVYKTINLSSLYYFFCNDLSLTKVIAFKFLGRGKTPWIHYVNKAGRIFATFLPKKILTGYAWSFPRHQNYAYCANKNTGQIYQVSPNSCTCSCFKYQVPQQKRYCEHQERYAVIKNLSLTELNKINQQSFDFIPNFDSRKYPCQYYELKDTITEILTIRNSIIQSGKNKILELTYGTKRCNWVYENTFTIQQKRNLNY